ncbi:MAG: DUF3662 and FHA domain-containing protein [Coriobacteriales bacterium]|nr:DUF3662 and FHA domain-containing protein [Coriobacteriales bacterium]
MSKVESGLERGVETAAGAAFKSPIEPAQIAKRAEKQMKRNRLVGAGRQYAPTLYNVLVNPQDDKRLFGFYPTMAAEIETYLLACGQDASLEFDGRPLVRFIVDDGLKKSGKFDVIAENVAAPTIKKLRAEEMEYYGIGQQSSPSPKPRRAAPHAAAAIQDELEPVDADTAYSGIPKPSRAVPEAAIPNVIPAKSPVAQTIPNANDSEGGVPATLMNISANVAYRLSGDVINIGRGDDCDIQLDDANASRVHARFTHDVSGAWSITDLGSTNGTLVNDRPVTEVLLRNGDSITIGLTTLEFHYE